MKKYLVRVVFASVWLSAGAGAQVAARTATPEEVERMETGRTVTQPDVEMASPLLLEVPIRVPDGPSKSRLARPVVTSNYPRFVSEGRQPAWSTPETHRYVCDRARVSALILDHGKLKKDEVEVSLGAYVVSTWYRQDLDVTLSLVAPDGKELAKKMWDDETVGEGGSKPMVGHAKYLELKYKLPRAEWDRWASGEVVPSAKILVQVQGDDEED